MIFFCALFVVMGVLGLFLIGMGHYLVGLALTVAMLIGAATILGCILVASATESD